MRETGRATLYLVKRADGWYVTNWPNSLSFKAHGVRESHGFGFGGRYPIVTASFAFDGQWWSVRDAGYSQIAHCRRTKEKVQR
jgi:hypothetical protein